MRAKGPRNCSRSVRLRHHLVKVRCLPRSRRKLAGPRVFSCPTSPRLTSQVSGHTVSFSGVGRTARILDRHCSTILMRKTKKLVIPLARSGLAVSCIRRSNCPLIFIASKQLKDVGRALLDFRTVRQEKVGLRAIVCGLFPRKRSGVVRTSARACVYHCVRGRFPSATFIGMPYLWFVFLICSIFA